MKHLTIALVAVMLLAGSAAASTCGPKVWDDMSWWCHTGATPEAVPDTGAAICDKGPRSGYWWWPTEAASNNNDEELWGNRGVVYNMCEATPPPPPPTEPPKVEPPKVERTPVLFNNVLFDFDKAVLKPEGKVEVDKIIAELKKNANDTIAISGHTCDLGSDAYNQALGERRANAVKKYMVENGIAEARITSTSLGETKPAVANDGAANRKLNRRAEFLITVVNP